MQQALHPTGGFFSLKFQVPDLIFRDKAFSLDYLIWIFLHWLFVDTLWSLFVFIPSNSCQNFQGWIFVVIVLGTGWVFWVFLSSNQLRSCDLDNSKSLLWCNELVIKISRDWIKLLEFHALTQFVPTNFHAWSLPVLTQRGTEQFELDTDTYERERTIFVPWRKTKEFTCLLRRAVASDVFDKFCVMSLSNLNRKLISQHH